MDIANAVPGNFNRPALQCLSGNPQIAFSLLSSAIGTVFWGPSSAPNHLTPVLLTNGGKHVIDPGESLAVRFYHREIELKSGTSQSSPALYPFPILYTV